MQKFENFYFKNFEFDLKTFKAKFYYSFDKKQDFVEEIDFFSKDFEKRKNLDIKIIKKLLFHLFIALGISYYKLYPKAKIILEKGSLDDFQIKFWKKFYLNGLGEFLYVNKLDSKIIFSEIIQVDNVDKIEKNSVYYSVSEKYLVPIGGGKDSIVSIELLKKINKQVDSFVFGKMDSIKENCIKVGNLKNLFVSRKLSPNLFELNKAGYYNGHVPITGIITFVLEVVAYLYDYKYLVLSNEKSANFGNTIYKGIEINHQYSKSFEFEKDLEIYTKKYLNKEVKYFSLLRNMYEYKIAQLFAKYGKKYFEVFSSCNNNFKINTSPQPSPTGEGAIPKQEENVENAGKYSLKQEKIWCNNCPKCAFVYSILSSFLSRQDLSTIFKKELYNEKNLVDTFEELAGISGHKPLECVGESGEVILGMWKYYKKLKQEKEEKLPIFLEIFEKKVIGRLCEEMGRKCEENGLIENYFYNLEQNLLKISDKQNLIPKDLKKQLEEII